jgi:hypothetical protein
MCALVLRAAATGLVRSPRAALWTTKCGRTVSTTTLWHFRSVYLDTACAVEQHILGLDVAMDPSHLRVQHDQPACNRT